MEKETANELDNFIKETKKKIEGYGGSEPGSIHYGKGILDIIFNSSILIYRSVKSLENTIDQNAEASNNLARKVFWLNIILTTATAAGVLIALFNFIYPILSR